jgi:hypothetical protein
MGARSLTAEAAKRSWIAAMSRAIANLESVLADTEKTLSMGREWQRGMARHYGTRIDFLMGRAPAGTEQHVRVFADRVSRILASFRERG